jgi:hypothetical protein
MTGWAQRCPFRNSETTSVSISQPRGVAPLEKSIVYSLIDLRDIRLGCNHRFLAHLAHWTTFPPAFVPSSG